MKKLLLVLFVGLLASIQIINAVNYAMNLPGGTSGTMSNIEISGVPLNTLPYTIEFWINIKDKQVQYAGLVYHRVDAAINSGVQFAASWQMGATPNAIRINNNTSGYGLISDTITLNSWHHIAVVVTDNKRTCYVDGHETFQNVVIPPYDFSIGKMWIGRDSANASNDNRVFKGLIDEVRIWNVAKTKTELESSKYLTLKGNESGLVGYWNFNDSSAIHATDLSASGIHGKITGGTYVRSTPEELMTAVGKLDLGNLNEITENLNLPAVSEGDVQIRWTTTNSAVIDTTGKVTRPEMYNATVILTAELSKMVDGVKYTLTKKFTAVVKSVFEAALQVAKWDFSSENITTTNGVVKVREASENGFTATLVNDAKIRTIGNTEKFNVLDLGNGTGYMDMGTDIGKAIYALNNYTVCGYFRIDEDYTELNNNGNMFWTFSNTMDAANDKTGYIIASLKSQTNAVSRMNNTIGNESVGIDSNAVKGSWHHIAYTQSGTTGTLYIDGIQVAQGTVLNIPATSLLQSGRVGTLYNWLGKSPYTSDSYLRKTLIYDFQLWSDAMSYDDLNYDLQVNEVIGKLNNAYNENSDYLIPELDAEYKALTISNNSALTNNIVLPTKGSIDQTVSIIWKTSNAALISNNGEIIRPDYFPLSASLTATLYKGGQSISKTFKVTVKEKDGTAFNGNLLVKHDFKTINDSIVTESAEKHLKGTLKNGAVIRTIGEVTKINTLDLTDSTAYFDLGTDVGKLIYSLKDYTMSCYYRIDPSYTAISNAGNFLWAFSNSDKLGTDQNGCLFGGLRSQTMAITPKYWSYGEQVLSASSPALQGNWHNMTYVQKDTIGTLFIDGMPVASDTITWLPSNTLPISERTGTLYNWLGRSCYVGDAYLTKTLIHDFRIYNKALTEEQIQISELNVGATINALEAAYMENPNNPTSIKTENNEEINIYSTNGGIKIHGLKGNENINIYDITGRLINTEFKNEYILKNGIYLIKINNKVTKLFVK